MLALRCQRPLHTYVTEREQCGWIVGSSGESEENRDWKVRQGPDYAVPY